MSKKKVTRIPMEDVYRMIGFEEADEIESVDGSDVDRVVNELIARGGADAILGRFLRDKIAEYYSTVDPESEGGA